MNHAERQQREELCVFLEFAAICPLRLKVNTVQNRPEPEPDILCSLFSGEQVAFELVQSEDVTAYTNAKDEVYVQSIHYKESRPGVYFSAVGTSIVDEVEEKLKKARAGKYLTDHPIHLLAWSDTASRREWFAWKNDLEGLLANGTSLFKRIWVYGRAEKAIVFDSNQHV